MVMIELHSNKMSGVLANVGTYGISGRNFKQWFDGVPIKELNGLYSAGYVEYDFDWNELAHYQEVQLVLVYTAPDGQTKLVQTGKLPKHIKLDVLEELLSSADMDIKDAITMSML